MKFSANNLFSGISFVGCVLLMIITGSGSGCVDRASSQSGSIDSVDLASTQLILKNMQDANGAKPEAIYRYNNPKLGEASKNIERAYLAIAPCCDFFNPLFDQEGKVICSPSGGFAGNGDGTCADFDKNNPKGELIYSRKENNQTP